MVKFELTKRQKEKANKWMGEKLKSPSFPQAAIGGAFTYEFTPTGICTFESIKFIDGDKLDLTEYDKI